MAYLCFVLLFVCQFVFAHQKQNDPWQQEVTFKIPYRGEEFKNGKTFRLKGVLNLKLFRYNNRGQSYIVIGREHYEVSETDECVKINHIKEQSKPYFFERQYLYLCFPQDEIVELHEFQLSYYGQRQKTSNYVEGFKNMTDSFIQRRWQ